VEDLEVVCPHGMTVAAAIRGGKTASSDASARDDRVSGRTAKGSAGLRAAGLRAAGRAIRLAL
jgi:hypothetical protein